MHLGGKVGELSSISTKGGADGAVRHEAHRAESRRRGKGDASDPCAGHEMGKRS